MKNHSPKIKKYSFSVVMLFMIILGAGLPFLTGWTEPSPSEFRLFLWLPFLLLLILDLAPLQIRIQNLIGAAVGALFAIYTPYCLLWVATLSYNGGGANIGLGLLYLAQPLYLPLFMIAGFIIVDLRKNPNQTVEPTR